MVSRQSLCRNSTYVSTGRNGFLRPTSDADDSRGGGVCGRCVGNRGPVHLWYANRRMRCRQVGFNARWLLRDVAVAQVPHTSLNNRDQAVSKGPELPSFRAQREICFAASRSKSRFLTSFGMTRVGRFVVLRQPEIRKTQVGCSHYRCTRILGSTQVYGDPLDNRGGAEIPEARKNRFVQSAFRVCRPSASPACAIDAWQTETYNNERGRSYLRNSPAAPPEVTNNEPLPARRAECHLTPKRYATL
jgi:hypothetical protein